MIGGFWRGYDAINVCYGRLVGMLKSSRPHVCLLYIALNLFISRRKKIFYGALLKYREMRKTGISSAEKTKKSAWEFISKFFAVVFTFFPVFLEILEEDAKGNQFCGIRCFYGYRSKIRL